MQHNVMQRQVILLLVCRSGRRSELGLEDMGDMGVPEARLDDLLASVQEEEEGDLVEQPPTTGTVGTSSCYACTWQLVSSLLRQLVLHLLTTRDLNVLRVCGIGVVSITPSWGTGNLRNPCPSVPASDSLYKMVCMYTLSTCLLGVTQREQLCLFLHTKAVSWLHSGGQRAGSTSKAIQLHECGCSAHIVHAYMQV